jgi:hypothetical protein
VGIGSGVQPSAPSLANGGFYTPSNYNTAPSIIVVNLIPVIARSGFTLRLLPMFTEGRRRSCLCFD